MSPPKATPDMKQRGIASFFGGGGGAGRASAGAAKKTPAAETTTTVEAKKASASAEADAAATVVDAKQREEPSAGKKVGDNDVVMVDSLDSDVKREASPAPKKKDAGDDDDDDDEEPMEKKPAKRLRKVAERENERETASAEPEAEAEEPAAAAATKPSPAAARKSPSPAAAKGKGKATATPTSKNDDGDDDDDGEKVEGVGAGALAAAAAHAAADVAAAAASWPAGTPVPFEFLADVFESVADETKRLVIANRLATAFRAVLSATPGDLLPAVYLCTNRVAPAHAGVELGVGDATLIRALAEATGRSESKVKLDLDRRGDLGVVAAEARAAQKVMFKPKPLTVASVYAAFRDIAASSGSGSSERKRGLIKKLLSAAGRREAGYVVRGLQGKLRIGLAEQTVLAALAVAAELHHSPPPSPAATSSKPQKLAEEALLANRLERAAQAVKRAYCECPSYDVIVPALVARAPAFLPETARFVAGVPVKPMLAKPATGVSEVLDRAAGGELLAEYKYDGERAQVHVFWEEAKKGGAGGGGAGAPPPEAPGATTGAAAATTTTPSAAAPTPNLRRRVAIYSRNSEDNSGKYPDVAEAVLRALAPGVRELVLDAEVVAIDRASGKILPFQVLSTRKRGTVTAAEVTVPVCLFAFDCLYKDGETLLRRPLSERREALASSLVERPGEVQLAVGSRESGVEQLAGFLDEAVAGGTEGLIVKSLDSTYEPSRRSTNWLKLKKDYLDGVGDTFDVVVLGAWHGRGKRAGVFGAFLLAVYDAASETYQSISRIGTGFSEAALESVAARLSGHVIPQPRSYYSFGEAVAPDVWFEPAVVWEVKAADLSVSPVHKAAMGLVDRAKGISIRFPRLVRERDDKRPEQATSAAQVAEMYRRQALTMNQAEVDGEKNRKNGGGSGGGGGGGGGYDDDDYY